MANYEVRDNNGSMFLVEQKKQDNYPDFEGSIRVNGEDYWISGWKKQGNNKKFISLSVKPKDPSKRNTPPATADAGW